MTAETAGFIAAQRTDHGVPRSVACRALEAPEPAFCKHLNRPPTPAQSRRRVLDAEVNRVFGRSEGTCGSPRVTAQLRRDGIAASNKTVEASMARQGLCARPKPNKRGLTGQNPGDAAPTDLLRRDFSANTSRRARTCRDGLPKRSRLSPTP
ncbi:MAG: IS3 family transposase [Acidimicrobiaceae bacterium]|nr:IS3 family transposase [Acidimicrobiaceae bacterium]